jgi:protease-4
MTEKEDLMLRSVVMDSYEQFVEAISVGRNMEKEDIYPLADGSIFTGLQAYNLGLVDTLGGLTEAIEIAAELAGVEGKPTVVRPYERKKLSPLDLLGGLFGWAASSVGSQFDGPQLMYLAR